MIKPLFHAKLNFQPVFNEVNVNFYQIYNAILTKFKWLLDLEGVNNYIEICAKYEEKGNYIIAIHLPSNEENIRMPFIVEAMQIFVKVDDKLKKCVSTKIKIESDELRNTLGKLKTGVGIAIVKSHRNLKDGEMIKQGNKLFNDFELYGGEYPFEDVLCVQVLKPLFDDEKITENKNTFNTNVTKYLKQREEKYLSKNILFKESWQKWFLFDGKFYKVGENGKADYID
ncbi:unnamed protein product [Meloidogyne enterolobii]|uniref:Uncharacterized protein n=1 Tax=Meloidogyne enterolobii TaxID=390850 RepID=A0ACB0ZLX0_MELEN